MTPKSTRESDQDMIASVASSATPGLPNSSFYQAAAALLGVLLLTGVVTEVRATRTESIDDWQANQWSRRSLYGFLALSVVVLAGELAALTVLLRQEASPALQVVVGVSLILGLVGVPGLVFLGVARDVVGSTVVMRWFRIASIYAAIIAGVVVAVFVLPPVFTGSPGVGTPNTVSSEDSESGFATRESIARGEHTREAPNRQQECLRLPSPHGPRVQVDELEALWFGSQGVGSNIAGCPGVLHTHRNPAVVWVEGVNPKTGRLLGIGIAGAYRAALLLGDAAAVGSELLQRGELVGASARVSAGAGDLYLLYTKRGASVLLRQTVAMNGSEQPYVLLPPPVAAAWLGAMRETRRWLWVASVAQSGNDSVYRLKSSGSSGGSLTVTYRDATGEAIRSGYTYTTPTPMVNFEELESLLPSA
jgi:hypothetical protein